MPMITERYTKEKKDTIIKMLEAGHVWKEIGEAIGKGGSNVYNYVSAVMRRKDLLELGKKNAAVRLPAAVAHPTNRNAETDANSLKAGHPLTWGAITVGTLLEGEPFK